MEKAIIKTVKIYGVELDLYRYKKSKQYKVFFQNLAVGGDAKTQKEAIQKAKTKCEKMGGKPALLSAIQTCIETKRLNKFREDNKEKFKTIFGFYPFIDWTGFRVTIFERELMMVNPEFRKLNETEGVSMKEAIEKIYGLDASKLVLKYISYKGK